MTARQREYYDLYIKGLGVCEIARICGKSKSTVSARLKNARENIYGQKRGQGGHHKRLRAAGKACPYSPDCFTCPQTDCVIDTSSAPSANNLTSDLEGAYL